MGKLSMGEDLLLLIPAAFNFQMPCSGMCLEQELNGHQRVPAVGKQVLTEQGAFYAHRKIGYLLRRLFFIIIYFLQPSTAVSGSNFSNKVNY